MLNYVKRRVRERADPRSEVTIRGGDQVGDGGDDGGDDDVRRSVRSCLTFREDQKHQEASSGSHVALV